MTDFRQTKRAEKSKKIIMKVIGAMLCVGIVAVSVIAVNSLGKQAEQAPQTMQNVSTEQASIATTSTAATEVAQTAEPNSQTAASSNQTASSTAAAATQASGSAAGAQSTAKAPASTATTQENNTAANAQTESEKQSAVQQPTTQKAQEATAQQTATGKNHALAATYKEQADTLEKSETKDAATWTTQREMNTGSYAYYQKWDALLNDVYQDLREQLPENKFDALRTEQKEWIAERDEAIDAAEEKVKGGTAESLNGNSVASKYTQERVYALIDMLQAT